MATILRDMNIFTTVKIQKVDIVVATVPLTVTELPLMAPAILKSIAEKKCQMSCAGLDLNHHVNNWIKDRSDRNKFLDFFHTGRIDPTIEIELENMHLSYALLLLAHRPKIVALSLFTEVCQESCRAICRLLKKHKPNIKILIGGAGCFENLRGHAMFAEELLESNLIDHYIRGDGEKAFESYLKGQFDYPGINNSDWAEIPREELDSMPYPNYDDYNMHLYRGAVPIVGSRGCVQKCKFCDIIEHWKKFNYRSGQSIFNEMLEQNKKYNIRRFKFQDSLINGNLKEFKKLILLLAEHNEKNPDNSFYWSSYFIFRPQSTFGEEWWELTAKSGATVLIVGVESLVESIRKDMGKNFSNEDLEFSMKMLRKYNLSIIMLLLVGWITETQRDIEYAKQWFTDHQEYKDLIQLDIGPTLGIYPNTWLDRNKDKLNIIKIDTLPQSWKSLGTDASTPQIRANWHKELADHCKELNFNITADTIAHYLIERIMLT